MQSRVVLLIFKKNQFSSVFVKFRLFRTTIELIIDVNVMEPGYFRKLLFTLIVEVALKAMNINNLFIIKLLKYL